MKGTRMKVQRFEDLICWQKARVLTNLIYGLTRSSMFAKDFELVRQIRRAALSSMSNIAEGFDRWSRKELIRFLDIAKGSAGEVRSQLYVALDQQYVTAQQFSSAVAATLETTSFDDSSLDLSADFCNLDHNSTTESDF